LAAIVIGEYSAVLFGLPKSLESAIGSGIVICLAFLQWIGVRSGSRTQTVTAVVKTLTFLALIVACFAWGGAAGFAESPAPTPSGFALVTALVLSMQAVIFTFDGYYAIIYFSGEMRNPGRDIPRIMFGGVATLAVLYILVNVAFLYVLPLSRMAGDPLVAAAAAREVFGAKADTIIRTLTILSLLSAVNAWQMMASRIVYRLGEQGFIPGGSYVNRGGTPVVGLVLSTIVSLALVLTGTFQMVLAITAFFFVSEYTLAFGSLLVLRRREPDAPRPYRARGHPWTTWGVFLLSIGFLLGAAAADTRNSLFSLILLALSWPIYLLVRPKPHRS
jgi:basic amino acid/polyamine antiporter, APA family